MTAATDTIPRGGPGTRRDRRPGATASGPERTGDLTVEIRRGAGRTVVVAAGRLGREGGELLAALLTHARRADGAPVTVDLRRISGADRLGVAAVLDEGPALDAVSPVVDRELSALAAVPSPACLRRPPVGRG